MKVKEIRVQMIFPISGKWTIETREGGEFILTDLADQSASAHFDVDEFRIWKPEERDEG